MCGGGKLILFSENLFMKMLLKEVVLCMFLDFEMIYGDYEVGDL